MPRKKTDEQTEETGPRRGDYVLVEDSVVRVGGDGLPDLEPRYRVMVVGRVKLSAVVEVVSPEQHVPGDAKAETGRTSEFTTAYPIRERARERLGGMGASEVRRSPGAAWTTPGSGSPARPQGATWVRWRRPGGTGSGPWPTSQGGRAGEPDEPADDEPNGGEPADGAERPANGRVSSVRSAERRSGSPASTHRDTTTATGTANASPEGWRPRWSRTRGSTWSVPSVSRRPVSRAGSSTFGVTRRADRSARLSSGGNRGATRLGRSPSSSGRRDRSALGGGPGHPIQGGAWGGGGPQRHRMLSTSSSRGMLVVSMIPIHIFPWPSAR